MTCGLVHASYSLPEWQAVKLTFFAPYILSASDWNASYSVYLLLLSLSSSGGLEQAIVSQPVVAFDFETERCDKTRYQFSGCEMKEIGARAVTKGKGPRFPPGCCELDPLLLS